MLRIEKRWSMKMVFSVVIMLAGVGLLGTNVQGQELKLGNPSVKALIVEQNYIYTLRAYAETSIYEYGAVGRLSANSPERTLLEFFSEMAKGNVDRGVTFWTKSSQALIARKNASISRDDLVRSARGMFQNLSVRFVNRLDYASYVILEVEFLKADKTRASSDSYALQKEGENWKLTQALADDPVMCCWQKAQNGRITRMGVPGGDFSKILESLK